MNINIDVSLFRLVVVRLGLKSRSLSAIDSNNSMCVVPTGSGILVDSTPLQRSVHQHIVQEKTSVA